jgi:hypothetical protein
MVAEFVGLAFSRSTVSRKGVGHDLAPPPEVPGLPIEVPEVPEPPVQKDEGRLLPRKM